MSRKHWQRMGHLQARAIALGREEFVQEYPAPVLISREIRGGMLEKKSTSRNALHTQKVPISAVADSIRRVGTHLHISAMEFEGDVTDPGMLITRRVQNELYTPVEKSVSDRNSPWITVGRTADTDVMINDFSVSKLHAKISIDPILNQYSLVDCGSTNGTSVEEVALTPETPYPIRSKMRIGFGRLCFEILSPRDLFAYLTDRAEGPTSLDIPAIKDD